ncbi:hypothetical protein M4D81_27945 [Paenibacillus sp. p3-SID867]|uniref:hypothetical protein n=1 Tax=Paenibacillus sp. p3-SID867 TaxID=2916363 RepID=UPI0021A72827|nr:hypothetical protein [Paenibacillus sp. p3-SID867]MCT1402831.1 hypothetical protein [Paenibacillus sp. p3-SID867]
MNTGPKKRPLVLTDKQREVLQSLVRRRLTPQQVARELSNLQISRRIPLDRPQVGVWRERWIDQDERLRLVEAEQPDELELVIVEILSDASRPGAPARFTPEQIVQIVASPVKIQRNLDVRFRTGRLGKSGTKPSNAES